eukprot:SAG11_NODE_316_length_10846_cov_8.188239_13_plen_167_part_00
MRYRVSTSGTEIYRIFVPWPKSFGSGNPLYRLCTALWLVQVDESNSAAVILADSMYAANAVRESIKVNEKGEVVAWCVDLLERARRADTGSKWRLGWHGDLGRANAYGFAFEFVDEDGLAALEDLNRTKRRWCLSPAGTTIAAATRSMAGRVECFDGSNRSASTSR